MWYMYLTWRCWRYIPEVGWFSHWKPHWWGIFMDFPYKKCVSYMFSMIFPWFSHYFWHFGDRRSVLNATMVDIDYEVTRFASEWMPQLFGGRTFCWENVWKMWSDHSFRGTHILNIQHIWWDISSHWWEYIMNDHDSDIFYFRMRTYSQLYISSSGLFESMIHPKSPRRSVSCWRNGPGSMESAQKEWEKTPCWDHICIYIYTYIYTYIYVYTYG